MRQPGISGCLQARVYDHRARESKLGQGKHNDMRKVMDRFKTDGLEVLEGRVRYILEHAYQGYKLESATVIDWGTCQDFTGTQVVSDTEVKGDGDRWRH